MTIKTILIDQRNYRTELQVAADAISKVGIIGIDCETEDSRRHEGLNRFCRYDAEGHRPSNAKLVFDMQRTTVCGFSVYPDNHDVAWYINLAHADRENRIPWEAARDLIQAKSKGAHWIAHNAPFELTVFRNALKEDLEDIVCTLQMAVSTYGPDEYNKQAWIAAGLGAMEKFVPQLIKAAAMYDGGDFEGDLADIVIKIIAKESRAAHSYNGFCAEHKFGYGLKQVVKSLFGVQMSTFEETLGENAHMGQITGETVAAYGAEDAYWAVKLFHKLLSMIVVMAPNAVNTFFQQENPMTYIYSDIWSEGVHINRGKVDDHRAKERAQFAELLRELKAYINAVGGFPEAPDERLMKREGWYQKNHAKYRKKIMDWAKTPDNDDAFLQTMQVRGAVSKAWASERGEAEPNTINLTHYMPMRTLLYDFIGAPVIMSKGKVQSNGEARGKIAERLEKKSAEIAKKRLADAESAADGDDTDDEEESTDLLVVDEIELAQNRREQGIKIIDAITKLGGCEQRMKMYLTPYVYLTDPDTNHMYPNVTSQLATRRMAASNPNPMFLQKRGEGTYVREFFEGDTPDDVVVSLDWSGIELVIVGEQSGDPEFKKAFGQLPHADLHSGTASSVLAVEVPLLNEVSFKAMKSGLGWDEWQEKFNLDCELRRIKTKLNGLPMLTPNESFKYWRNEVGKIANFNYWFSGWLATIGEKMGWDQSKTAEAVERFRQRFAIAEAWRMSVIDEGRRQGWIELPDGHRRTRWEATDNWMEHFLAKWPDGGPGFNLVISKIAQKIQKRAHNQLVNAKVQGTCATIAKRSLIRIKRDLIKAQKMPARHLFPVHDELVFNCKREAAPEFIVKAREIMIDHPTIFKTLALDASPSVGLNFSVYDAKKSPYGQVELFEPPAEIVGDELANKRLDEKGMGIVIDYLFEHRQRMAA